MKKIITLLCLIATMQNAIAQGNNTFVTKADLTAIKNPLERFTATIKYLENADTGEGDAIDSALCIDLQKIATQLKNDSLLAISYNWINAYMNSKGRTNEAIEYLYKALPLAEKYNDKRRISLICLLPMVLVWVKKRNPLIFLKKAGKICQIKHHPCTIICWCNINEVWH
jgi:hypothetical protein